MILGRAKQMILSGNTDKSIRRIYMSVISYVNKIAPTKDGFLELISRAAGVDLPNVWTLPIPADAGVYQRQVDGIPTPGENFGWARALEIEIRTSLAVSGSYVPVTDQPEEISAVILEIMESGPRRKASYK